MGLLLIEGPAGIGKSRLIAELRERAGAGDVRVLAAYGSDLEREFPFDVVRQLFEPLPAGAAARQRLLRDAAAAARPVFDDVDPAGDGGDVSFAALRARRWLHCWSHPRSPKVRCCASCRDVRPTANPRSA